MFDKREFNLKKFILRLIGIFIVILLFKSVYDNIDDFIFVKENFKRIPINILILLTILQIITQLLLALQWHKISSVILVGSNFFKMFYILSTGSVIESLTPGAKIGGEATRLYYLKKEFDCPTDIASNIIIIQKSISMSVLFTISLGSFVYLLNKISNNFSIFTQFIMLAMCIISILFLISLLFFTERLSEFLDKSNKDSIIKINNYIKSYSNSVSNLTKSHWLLQFSISMVVWLLFPLKMYILTQSVGLNMNFFVVLAITMSSYMIGMLPLTPGGIGTFEASMINLLTTNFISIELPLAVTITIVFRFITFWFVMLLSVVFIVFKFIVDYIKVRKNS